ncbi:hypothetical protein [Arcticibacterium luteifluviistationis]|uniref:Glycosyltransferase 2-like domain-containing protein n=1 Tax=Arcticibacterium luteifluviistationis TaxID=1784714 RepID=A0A2Z4GGU9_9BACT|nr:hypothetical protein [Arcticibacterium luteifluviistationis]AWW00467.1 hypothetical protein DJ013_20710 [Arcticibacterium luteifluviistationis]
MKQRDHHYISVCIPAYNEPDILTTLNSLVQAATDGLTTCVYVLINGSKKDDVETIERNLKGFEEVNTWIKAYSGQIKFKALLDLDLPVKHAGVGLARKILGDLASQNYKANKQNGVIVYLDADCEVKENYFQAISAFFKQSEFNAAAIHFEHIINDEKEQRDIIEYESHLRYYILMQRYLDLPFAIHTVGSSMAVMSDTYLAKGGMNRRKAGEDFYFMHKFIKDGECGNIHDTTVYPSGRISERVPFGTGRAMLKYEEEGFKWQTYNPEAFLILKPFLERRISFYESDVDFSGLHEGLKAYLASINAKEKIELIKENVASLDAFEKRFFQFFDAFQLMKYLHFLRDEYGINDVPISEGVAWYFKYVMIEEKPLTLKDALLRIRKIDNKEANGN